MQWGTQLCGRDQDMRHLKVLQTPACNGTQTQCDGDGDTMWGTAVQWGPQQAMGRGQWGRATVPQRSWRQHSAAPQPTGVTV